MKKIISLVLCMLLAFCVALSAVSCTDDDKGNDKDGERTPCVTCQDNDNDGKCDVCGESVKTDDDGEEDEEKELEITLKVIDGDGLAVVGVKIVFAELEIEGNAEILDITAEVMYTDLEETGDFSCSDEIATKVYQNALWGQRDDCR